MLKCPSLLVAGRLSRLAMRPASPAGRPRPSDHAAGRALQWVDVIDQLFRHKQRDAKPPRIYGEWRCRRYAGGRLVV